MTQYDDDYYEDDYNDADDCLDDDTVSCPGCGAEVLVEVGKCPVCGYYLMEDDLQENSQPSKPLWWILLAVGGAVAFALASLFMF